MDDIKRQQIATMEKMLLQSVSTLRRHSGSLRLDAATLILDVEAFTASHEEQVRAHLMRGSASLAAPYLRRLIQAAHIARWRD